MSSSGIVPTMIDAAANAKIETHPLRRNLSILEGSGGNIVVLTGKDGKLLIDSGFAVSKPRITNALSNLSPDPITQFQYSLAHGSHGRKCLVACGGSCNHGACEHEKTSFHLDSRRRVALNLFLRRQQELFQQRSLTTNTAYITTTQTLPWSITALLTLIAISVWSLKRVTLSTLGIHGGTAFIHSLITRLVGVSTERSVRLSAT